MRGLRAGLLLAAAATLATALAGSVGASSPTAPGAISSKRTVVPAKLAGGHADVSTAVPSQYECTATSGGADTKLDCDDPFPNNEPNIFVDPANPLHMIGSSNDYGSCCDQYYTTLDGGQTWSTGNMSTEPGGPTGSDPVTSFDSKHGVALHSSLNYFFNDNGDACNGDVVVSPSKDGGLTWKRPVVVHHGFGCDPDPTQLFNDKEWITTDNNPASPHYGRTYLTWTAFLSHDGVAVSAPILEAHSDDGGKHWTKAQEISGSNPQLCTYHGGVPPSAGTGRCDIDQFSVPTVAPDGTVYVAFENSQNEKLWSPGELFDSQYLLVKSLNGGRTWSAPRFVVRLQDGTRDYPVNVDGRQTLTGYQVRVDSAGNIVASPKDGTLYLTFSDNRHGVHDSDNPVTNTDVFVMSSSDGGTSWTSPAVVDASKGDQWFPWVDVNPVTGTIGIVYNDRGRTNGRVYEATLAEGVPGSFTTTMISTAPSDPTHSVYFKAGAPGCEDCATFHGDYISVTYGSDGHANALWTDMRDFSPADGAFLQFVYYARH